ncbi:acetone carboxylase [Nesterenkonia sp. LB17]|uniref:acetone carboxylase n=1 Tax=unclassified Nesterenkonia TaxID=2629769 RepID=UPI001F4D0198|nr:MULTISPECIES: acetone carboxylase [unclassified Nesterenkonia]MCH8565348.1 acetone carboxylase [Nesterenkonia sp. LB17]MCH8571266.1 acetone carboxylase [Nesterenkonia sp. AY15]
MDLLNTLGGDGAQPGPQSPQCSRKDCRFDATWQVLWNNPKVHTPERRKIWLACDEHRPWLENYLAQRLFWRSTQPLDAGTAPESFSDTAATRAPSTPDDDPHRRQL